MTYRTLCLAALAVLAGAFASLNAQETGPLASELKAYLVTPATESAPESRVETDQVGPGQTVEYVLKYTNQSAEPLRNVVIDGPVPAELAYINDSVRQPEGQQVLFSIDDGQTFGVPPIKYGKQLEDGTTVEAVATPDQYNRLRWVVAELPASSSIEFAYRARVR